MECGSHRCFRTILGFVHWDSTTPVNVVQLGMAWWLSSVASLYSFFCFGPRVLVRLRIAPLSHCSCGGLDRLSYCILHPDMGDRSNWEVGGWSETLLCCF